MRIPRFSCMLAVLAFVAAATGNTPANGNPISEVFTKILNRPISVTDENLDQLTEEVLQKFEGFTPADFAKLEDFAKLFDNTEEIKKHMADVGSHKSLKKRNSEAEDEYFKCAICACGQEAVAAAQAEAEEASGGPLPLETAPGVLPQRVLPDTPPQALGGGMVINFPTKNAVSNARQPSFPTANRPFTDFELPPPLTNGLPTGFDPANPTLDDRSTLVEPPIGLDRLPRRLQKRFMFAIANIGGGMLASFLPEIKKGGSAVKTSLLGECKDECSNAQSKVIADVGEENYCSNGRPFPTQ